MMTAAGEIQNTPTTRAEILKISEAAKIDGEQLARRIWGRLHGDLPVVCSDSEYISWKESLPRLIRLLDKTGLGHVVLLPEYQLPTGGRIDAVLLGYAKKEHVPLAVIVEMKQWSDEGIRIRDNGFTVFRVENKGKPYLSIHPIRQTKQYREFMERNHSGVLDGKLSVVDCQYLFNFEKVQKAKLFEGDFAQYAQQGDRLFCKGEEDGFCRFLNSVFSAQAQDHAAAIAALLDGCYRMTDLDLEVFREITGKPENIGLIEDQVKCVECIDMAVKRLLAGTLKGKQMFLVHGAAGTGKTIVGFKLLNDYCQMIQQTEGSAHYKCAYALPRSRTIKAILDGVGGGFQATFLNLLKGNFDLLVVDEAHRVTDFDCSAAGTGSAFNRAEIVVVLQDDHQRVLGNEVGTFENYKKFAQLHGFAFQSFSLNLQKRAGFGGYVENIDRLLYGKGDPLILQKNGIEIRVCDTLKEMQAVVEDKSREDKSIKYYAPYCWKWNSRENPHAMDIIIPEENFVFQKQWNPFDLKEQYRWYKDSIDRVGCIYTAQGLGYDYVALIWWDDLRWDKTQKKWIVDFGKVTPYDLQLGKTMRDTSRDYDYLMLNIYRVLLTRAKKGIYIWFKDPDTKKHFEEIVQR